jgi:hypothetical protein
MRLSKAKRTQPAVRFSGYCAAPVFIVTCGALRCYFPFLVLAFLVGGRLLAASPGANQTPPAATASLQLIPASDVRFRYDGWFDFADRARPVVVWQGSRISLDFSGSLLVLHFAAPSDQTYFNFTIDGETLLVGMPAVAPAVEPGPGTWLVMPRDGDPGRRVAWPRPLGPGRHHLELFKRSEASAGHIVFLGAQLAPGAHAWAPAAPDFRLRLQFIGDSITAGACNEDGPADQWDNRGTHNFALSYAALAAQAFHADLRCMAVSGMGITPAWAGVTAAQVWDRIYPRPDAPRADLAAWLPEVVCINLGENDDSFNRSHHRPFPADYAPGYVAFVRSVRAVWPQAHIVLLQGGMFGGAKGEELRKAWTVAVRELEAGDPAISHFVFAHWSINHPRVADDRAMAKELVAWLRQQPFMRHHR